MGFADRRIIVRAVLAVVLVSAVGLSACGRKGALEPPPGPAATSGDGGQSEDTKKNKSTKPDRPFALDFLL